MGILNRLAHAWNVFLNREAESPFGVGEASYGSRPDRTRLRFTNDKSIISAIYNRIAIDIAEMAIKHVRLDEKGRFSEEIDSGINNCLTLEANIDQAAREFKQDMIMSLFDEGVIAITPIDTTLNPNVSTSFDIKTMRVGTIVRWSPQHVRVSVYNEQTGRREEVTVGKRTVAIVQNPLYAVMNEPNSTLQRLIRTLNHLDAVDEQTASGKLDMFIQLPYAIKSQTRRDMAEKRRKDIEVQLKGSKYGIAYVDGTEKITQLNRPSENNLLKQVEWLTELLYSQLGITKDVMDGTATEAVMRNYHNRTIKPILQSIVEAMRRSFLTKTARSQGQSIEYFRDPFALIPLDQLAELADKLTRNEIVSSNEVRTYGLGLPPSKEKKADQLVNANMPIDKVGLEPSPIKQVPSVRVDRDRAQIEPPS